MNANEKRWIILLVLVIIIAIVLIVVIANSKKDEQGVDTSAQVQQSVTQNQEQYTTTLDDGTKLNTSENFNSDKTYGNLTISNVQFTEKDNISVLLADVTNNGQSEHQSEIVKITIYGDNNEVITTIKAVIGKIAPGETKKINASVTADVTNAKDFKIEAAN